MKTRRRKLRGGEAIEGAQGCVVIPSLIVDKAMRTRNTSYVTKIFFKDNDFAEEKAQNDMVMSKIDPRGTFTSAKYTTTPIDLTRISPQEIQSCSQLKGKDLRTLKFLNYKYLGKSIHDIVNTDMKINPKLSQSIISAIANLAVKILYMNNDLGMYHNDVHEGNIMFNFKEDFAYLIDFGGLSPQPANKNPLTDLQGLVTTVRLLAISAVGQNQLPSKLKDLLNSFIKDSSLTLTRASQYTDVKQARELISKFLTDFALAYTKTVGGRKKTLRRIRH